MDARDSKKTSEEMDRFWDIDALIPPRRAAHYVADTEATEIVIEAKSEEHTAASQEIPKRENMPERRFVPPHTAEEAKKRPPDEEYFPENTMIRTVRIFRIAGSYSYYDAFVRDADRLFAIKGEECEHVPFFSYVPQYTQMNRAQLEWYLWWRENFRRETYLTTDYSYVLLHAYELINLSEKLEPKYVQEQLCRLWLNYRNVFHQLDTHLPEWICDHGLLHRLDPPALYGQTLYAAMSRSTLKEFFVSSSAEDALLRGMLVFCSNYDYHKSKFCTPETRKLFRATILGALREVLVKTSDDGTLLNIKGMDPSRMVRDAYNGALCASRIRRRIAVEYSSFHCSHDLRYLITDIVKYTENYLRMILGVRARLSIYALPAKIRTLLDAFLEAKLPKKNAVSVNKKRNEEEIAYERLYDVPRNPLSLENAASIERASWSTTERLVDAFGDVFEDDAEEKTTTLPPAQPMPASPTASEQSQDTDAFLKELKEYLPFLRAVFEGNAEAQCAFAEGRQTLEEIVADEINGIAAEYMGDIILEETEQGFAVIEDYRTQVQDLIEKGNG